MCGKAQMRCLALRPPATDPQVEHALSLGPTLQVDVGHATDLVACRNVTTLIAGVHNPASTLTCGRLHRSRSCTPVQRNADASPRTPGCQHLVRPPSLAQDTYPGISGYHPHSATFSPSGLPGSCASNGSAHKKGSGRFQRSGHAPCPRHRIRAASKPMLQERSPCAPASDRAVMWVGN